MLDPIEAGICTTTMCILAGGLGTRVSEHFPDTPKCLIPVAGEPFIFHQLRLLHSQGIRRVVLATGHMGNLVEDTVGDGARFDLEVIYSDEGPNPLGTGGAISKAAHLLSDPFLFTYGDAYLRIDLRLFIRDFLESKISLQGSMAVLENNDQWGDSNCSIENSLVVEYSKNKPPGSFEYIDYGVSLLRKSALEIAPTSENYDIADLISHIAQCKALSSFEVNRRFYEIGTANARVETEQFLLRNKNRLRK